MAPPRKRSADSRRVDRAPEASSRPELIVHTDTPSAIRLVAAVLVVVTCVAYSNSFGTPFLFDDQTSIQENLSIRQLWPIWQVFAPPVGETVGGRPLLNLSFALNYAIGGFAVWGYHLVNLLIHLAAGLTLLGIIRRTLHDRQFGSNALPIAGAIALLWLLHPLQTESVTYIVQRAEALVSLCYLLALYAAIRVIDAPAERRWHLLALVASVAGMLSKEVMATAPFLILLYDRTFISGSFQRAWQRHRKLHLSLFATLLALAVGFALNGRGNTAGFDTDISVWSYALTQAGAIVHYLRLFLWPDRLIFDYGRAANTTFAAVAWQVALLLVLLLATAWALWRRPVVGFLAGAFFIVLAPSSSIVPIATQSMAEHRVYLALAALFALVVAGLWRIVGRWTLPLCALWAVALGWRTTMRNHDYRSDVAIWQDVVEKLPGNARGHHNFAGILAHEGRHMEALEHYREEVRLDPVFAQDGYSRALIMVNQLDAVTDSAEYLRVMRQFPDSAKLHITVGQVFVFLKRYGEAVEQFKIVLEVTPDDPAVHNELGKSLARIQRFEEAIAHFEAALRINPGFAEARSNLAMANKLKVER